MTDHSNGTDAMAAPPMLWTAARVEQGAGSLHPMTFARAERAVAFVSVPRFAHMLDRLSDPEVEPARGLLLPLPFAPTAMPAVPERPFRQLTGIDWPEPLAVA